MDPVSVAASLLTVLGAAGTATRALEHLSDIRHAPDQLLALINEVSVSLSLHGKNVIPLWVMRRGDDGKDGAFVLSRRLFWRPAQAVE